MDNTQAKLRASFDKYIMSLTEIGKGKEPPASGPDRPPEGERIRQLSSGTTGRIQQWEGIRKNFPNSEGSEWLWRYTLIICMKMEAWWNSLRIPDDLREGLITQGCQMDQIAVDGAKIRVSDNCQGERHPSLWNQKGKKILYEGRASEDRSLSICRELVMQMLLSFGITSTDTRHRDRIKEQSPCNKLYRSLKEWGGEEFTRCVMKDWFMNMKGGEGKGVSNYFSGVDLYEILSEVVYGTGKGDKNFVCVFQGEDGRALNPGEEPYKLELATSSPDSEEGSLSTLAGENYQRIAKELGITLPAVEGGVTDGETVNLQGGTAPQVKDLRTGKEFSELLDKEAKAGERESSPVQDGGDDQQHGDLVSVVFKGVGGGIVGLLGLLGTLYGYSRVFSLRKRSRKDLPRGAGIIRHVSYR
ncbi:hypothetical protein C922_05144 [Plasmodium inui San Antonio 1]|uniref:Uncharacterized protein n=1 Tax=Plasmodium inui San Antonio 1 TaxID=1237626 RepID=W7AGR3_9APIC|nr:hypothetical protein C922_05144 [Plasmodium inui San Antonio 1]EUD64481.1 hypothetical protein C922_05144 [Plasmodium inui San Antonio 1]